MAPKLVKESIWECKKQSIVERSERFVRALEDSTDRNAEMLMNKLANKVPGKGNVRQLGPSCVDDVPADIEKILNEHDVDDSSFFSSDKSWSAWGNKPIRWPADMVNWKPWVEHVEKQFGHVWKQLHIYDAIKLSTIVLPCDRSLLAAALCFWSSQSNSLELEFGALSLTLIDIAAILGFPPHGQVVDVIFAGEEFEVDLGYEQKTRARGRLGVSNYNTWISMFNAGSISMSANDNGESRKEEIRSDQGKNSCIKQVEVTDVEHAAFLALWICKFLVCPPSNKVSSEYFKLAEALASERVQASGQLLALGPFVLAHVYRCLHHCVTEGLNFNSAGPLWIFQLWLHTYFPMFRQPHAVLATDSILGLQLAPLELCLHSAADCFEALFTCSTFTTEQFAVCFTRKYPPFLGIDLSRDTHEIDDEDKEGRVAWRSAMSARDLFWGPLVSKSSKYGVELYFPAFFSRQLGYYQAVPAPDPVSLNRFSSLRIVFQGKDEVKRINTAFEYNKKFPVRKRVVSSECSKPYKKWWGNRVKCRFRQGLASARELSFSGNGWWTQKKINPKRCKTNTQAKTASIMAATIPLKKCNSADNHKQGKKASKESIKGCMILSTSHPPAPQKEILTDSEDEGPLFKRRRLAKGQSSNVYNAMPDGEMESWEQLEETTGYSTGHDGNEMDDEKLSGERMAESDIATLDKVNETLALTHHSHQASTHVSPTSSQVGKLEIDQKFEAEMQALVSAFSLDDSSHLSLESLLIPQPVLSEGIDYTLMTLQESLTRPLKDFVETDQIPQVKAAVNTLLEAGRYPKSKAKDVVEQLEKLSQKVLQVNGAFEEIEMRKQQSAACDDLKIKVEPEIKWCEDQTRTIKSLDAKIEKMEEELNALKDEKRSIGEEFVPRSRKCLMDRKQLKEMENNLMISQPRHEKLENDIQSAESTFTLLKALLSE